MLEKIKNGDTLTERELANLHKEFKRIKLFNKTGGFYLSVYQIGDKTYAMNWELKEDGPIFYQQPFLCKIENGKVYRYFK